MIAMLPFRETADCAELAEPGRTWRILDMSRYGCTLIGFAALA
jgi:hypothetical protein